LKGGKCVAMTPAIAPYSKTRVWLNCPRPFLVESFRQHGNLGVVAPATNVCAIGKHSSCYARSGRGSYDTWERRFDSVLNLRWTGVFITAVVHQKRPPDYWRERR